MQKLLIRLFVPLLLLMGFSFDAVATGPRITQDLFIPDANTIYALDFPPFISTDVAGGGVVQELANAVFEAEKLSATIVPQPLARMLKYYLFQENALAIIASRLKFSAEEQKQLVFVPLLRLKNYYYVYRAKYPHGLAWNNDLQVFSKLVYGASHEDEIDAYRKAGIRVENGKLLTLLERLKDGQVDFISGAEPAIDWFLRRNFKADQTQFMRLEPMAGDQTIFVIFNKKHPQGETIAKQFQDGLARLIANGQYQTLLEKRLGGSEGLQRYTLPLQ